MSDYLPLLLAFIAGGFLSMIAQLLIDLTNLTPARILVAYVCSGVLLYATGAYDPLFETFGTGVSLPLIGFGAAIARGVREAVAEQGALGVLTGGLSAAAAGTTAALVFGYLACLLFKGKPKS